MKRNLRVVAIFCVSMSFLPPGAANTSADAQQQIDRISNEIPPAVIIEGQRVRHRTLRNLMALDAVPGVSVAVIRNGRLAWARGFGVAEPGGAPITPNTRFIAGSISKPITALAVLKLVQSGVLNLDANVNQYLGGWKIPDNTFTAHHEVTTRELLDHTAGITVPGFGGYAYGTTLPTLVQTLEGVPPSNNEAVRVDDVPGGKWRYSGGGYVILRQLLMDATGEPFKELMRRMVLNPLGMNHSTFEQPVTPVLLSEVARPTGIDGIAFKPRIYPELAPDGLWTTASDLARYAVGVQRALAGLPPTVISRATAKLMLTPGPNHWGLGPIVGGDERHPFFYFNGGNVGYVCVLVAYNRGDGAVVMTNGSGGYSLAIDLIRSIAQEYHWQDLGPIRRRAAPEDVRSLQTYVGAYESKSGRFYVVSLKGSQLYIHASLEAKRRIFPMGAHRFFLTDAEPTTFYPSDDDVQIAFDSDSTGRATALTIYDNGVKTDGPAGRLSSPKATIIIDGMRTLEHRIESQIPTSGEEAVARKLFTDLAEGKPNYDYMTSAIANQVRSVVDLDRRMFSQLGALVAMSFEKVEPNGVDVYRVEFKNGNGVLEISLNASRKISYVQYEQEQGV